MENLLYFCIVVASFILVLLNEFILWKLWPKIFFPEISSRRKIAVATLIIDPLVASIICPLASDLYFSLDWLQSCDFFFVFIVLIASLTAYGSSIVMSFKIISSLIPANQGSGDETRNYYFSNKVCFALSLLINTILTWIILSLTIQGAEEFSPSEECFPFMVHGSIIFTCVLSYGFQMLFTVLYARLSISIYRCLKPVYSNMKDDSEVSLFIPMRERTSFDILTYSAISLTCLLLSHGLRSAFLLCSCLPFLQTAQGIYWINWLIFAKLPSIGLVYCTISRLI